ncbi:HAMP domain-containing sensor histidine kinase [Candidatus Pyrohabitans sp.]
MKIKLRLFHKVFLLFLLLSILPLIVVGTRITLLNFKALTQISQEMGIPTDVFRPLLERTIQEGITYSFYVIIIVVIVAIFFTASIVGPIERLREATRRISRGDYSFNPQVSTGDEIEDLMEAFKDMSEKLQGTMQELELANNQKRIFLDIMCHDLSNYLSIIGGFTSILQETESDEEKKKILDTIYKNAKRMEEVLENARRFARLEKGTALQTEECDLKAILLSVKDVFSQNNEGDRIKMKFPEGKLTIEADELIRDVFLNLVSNALKYSKDDVVVEAEDLGDRVRVAVRDLGPGIPDEHKSLVFERFWRFDKSGVQGTGLGLAIAKSIVELHKGRIWVEDNLPRGSVFFVELPKRCE